jgi:hypothetical protein
MSFLDTIRTEIKRGFAGKLRACTLMRMVSNAQDDFGDAAAPTKQTWTFDGMRDSFNAAFAAAAGIPTSDVRILIIAGSLATEPRIDDKIQCEGRWFQLRQRVALDPATATYTYSGFEVPAP